MKILFLLGLLAVLNIFSCAEVSSDKTAEEASDKELSDLEKLPNEILYKIGFYLITHSGVSVL